MNPTAHRSVSPRSSPCSPPPDKGLDVQIEVVPESQEAPYFFSLVRAEKQVEAGEWKI